MRITYDPQADALYIEFSKAERACQQQVNDGTIIDLSADGEVVGIEILDARATYGRDIMRLDFSLLGDLQPEAEQYLTPQEAAQIAGVNKETILRKIRTGELAASRPGKNYLIRKADLHKMLG